jgi:hypothetical protein
VLSQANMGTSSEDEPVLSGSLSLSTLQPAVRVERFGVNVDLRVVKRGVGGGDNHSTLRNTVLRSDVESLLDLVGNHKNGGTVTKLLLNNGTSVNHLINHVDVQTLVWVTVSHTKLLLTDFSQNVGSVGKDLELPGGGRRGGVLGGEQEGEDGHGDFNVGESTDNHRLGSLVVFLLFSAELLVLARVNHALNPVVHGALWLLSFLHGDLGHLCALGKFLKNIIGALLSVPGLGVRQDNREVDELKSGGNLVVVLGNVGDSLVADVASTEGSKREGAVDVTELSHVLSWLSVLGELNPSLKVLVVNLLLLGEVTSERLAVEKTVQSLAIIDVVLSIKENPVGRTENLLCDVDDTRVDVHRGVEDLSCQITTGGDNDESKGRSSQQPICDSSRTRMTGTAVR